jgi:putative membrane protein
MQATLLGTAVAFWAAVRRSSVATAVAALLATMVQMGLLGALITFAGKPLYAPHLLSTAAWGLSPLEDQQVAGLIMWAPAAAIYLAAALLIAARWLRDEARPAA